MFKNREKEYDYRLGINYSVGNYLYDGATQGGVPAAFEHRDQVFGGELLLNLLQSDSGGEELYSGIGYRQWNRDIGYTEEYKWFYIPVGVRQNIQFGDFLSIEPDVYGRFMFNSRMQIVKGLSPDLPVLTFNLGRTLGAGAKIPVAVKLSEGTQFVLTPWLEYTSIGKSDALSYFFVEIYEPDSSTWQAGVNAGLRFVF